jgi:drug/metabolite transporter (DMT)-like permease
VTAGTDGQPSSTAAAIPLAGTITVIVAACLFATLGILARWAYAAGMVPLTFVAWRAGIGTAGLAVLGAWQRRQGRPGVDLRAIGRRQQATLIVAIGLACVLNLAMFFAFSRVPIGLALLCFYTYPAMVAAVGVISGREPLDRARAIALGLATAGMVGVVVGGVNLAPGASLDALGLLAALGAAASQTAFVVLSRDGYRSVPTEQAMGTILLGTTVLTAFIAVLAGAGKALLLPLQSPDVLPLLLVVGIAGAAIPSFLFLTGIRLIGGTRTGVLMLIEPVVGVLLAAVLLHEGVAPLQVAGGAAILLGALIIQRAGRPATGESEAAALPAPGGP